MMWDCQVSWGVRDTWQEHAAARRTGTARTGWMYLGTHPRHPTCSLFPPVDSLPGRGHSGQSLEYRVLEEGHVGCLVFERTTQRTKDRVFRLSLSLPLVVSKVPYPCVTSSTSLVCPSMGFTDDARSKLSEEFRSARMDGFCRDIPVPNQASFAPLVVDCWCSMWSTI